MGTSDRSSLLAASRAFQTEGRFADARELLAGRLGDYADDSEILMEYATALSGTIHLSGDFSTLPEAVRHARRAVELAPYDLPKRRGLFLMLEAGRHNTEALEQIREIGRQDPSDPTVYAAQGALLVGLLRFDEALRVLEEGAARFPLNRVIAARFASSSNYMPGLDPARRKAIHERFGQIMRALSPQRPVKYANVPDPQRVIRLGLVSGDFRTHSCAHFLLQLIKNLDRTRVHTTCIYTMPLKDAITEQFRALADDFIRLSEPSQSVLVGAIRSARVDVLIDLSGHTSGSSLAALHSRPAPVQGTYLGYANTTGVDAIQFRFIDSLTDPTGAEAHATERLVRLDPCFLCFEPPADAPDPSPCPSDARGYVTFGSFNSPIKLNDPLIGLWARVLNAVPDSRLVLKGEALGDAEFAGIVRGKFASAGVDALRLDLLGKIASSTGHLSAYGQIDIALDSFPYHGTTTTCEAVWMGVPVVSRVGVVHASRVGLSLLTAVGLGDLAVDSDDEFVAKAAALARDSTRRRELRPGLRTMMRSSPLCDGPGFAARFELAIRGEWTKWCNAQIAGSDSAVRSAF